MATAEKMEVQVGHGFAPIRTVVHHKAIASRVQFQLAGDFLGGGKQVAEDGMVFGGYGGVAGMMLFRDKQNMHWGLRSDVAEGENVFVLVDDVGLGFPVDDPFKDRFGHGPPLPDGQFEELGTKMTGAGADKMDDLVVEPLAGSPPRVGP